MTGADAHTTPPPRAAVQQQLLDNGFQVVWEEDHRQPIVALEVRIKGGLRGEGPYLGTGITHFIEHMLFKGTTMRAPGTIDQEVRRYGGTINAFTSFDTTGISLFVDAQYVQEALGLLADILRHAVFEPAEFEKERAVIVSEIQMNLDDPHRRLSHLFWRRFLLEHPYRYPILGDQPLLESLTVEDLRRFYAAQYHPDRITIGCVGAIDSAAFRTLIQETFGAWPPGRADPSQQLVPVEPPSVSRKVARVEAPVQSAHVMLGFKTTRLSDPDTYPLDVLASILGHGLTARLYERLVRQERLVDSISAWNYTPYDPGVLGIQFRTDAPRVDAAAATVERVLREVVERGVTDDELMTAKRQVLSDYLFHLQTVQAKASDLVNSLALTGDPMYSWRYVEGIEAVTRAQVQAAARRYCDLATMTTVILEPAGAAAPAPSAAGDQEMLPVTKAVLGNGLTTLIGVDRRLPIVSLVIGFRGGVRVETEETQGLTQLAATLLTKGTSRRSASDIARAVESLGGSLEPFSGRDGFGLSLQLLAGDVETGIALLHELVSQSTFPEPELEIQRQVVLGQLQAQEDDVFYLGSRLARGALFAQHPYRFDVLGRPETIRGITRDTCRQFAKRWITPSNAVVAVFGDVNADPIAQKLQRTLGGLEGNGLAWPSQLPVAPLTEIARRAHTVEKEQAVVMLGFQGGTRVADDRYAIEVLTAVLSGMAGRLFQAVREAHGLSYTLGATHVPGWDPGYLLVYAATRPDDAAQVATLMEQQLETLVREGVSAEEVDQAKRHLIGQHRLEVQHVTELARRAVLDELYGLGFDAWTTEEARLQAVTPSDVHAAAKRYVTLPSRAQVIVSPHGHSP